MSSYIYLGLVLDEFLDYDTMATFVVNLASRALRLMISKFNTTGGLSYKVYTKLYEAIVWPTISYEQVIWETKKYSCINAMQTRSCLFLRLVNTRQIMVIWE